MKKILMTMAAMLVTMTMSAQVYVGGEVGFNSVSHDGNSTTAFTLKPEVGYVLDDNWALGLAFGYSESGKNSTKVKTLSVNPYARFTFAKFDHVNLFLDGGFDFTNVDSKSAGHKTNNFGIGVKPGVAVNLNEKISFVAHCGFLGYKTSKPDYDGAKSTDTVGFDFDANNITFGLYFNF